MTFAHLISIAKAMLIALTSVTCSLQVTLCYCDNVKARSALARWARTPFSRMQALLELPQTFRPLTGSFAVLPWLI